eukprot:CAMPEP_0185271060 /NCGR_PEP_ID=MMETSP1359-20130426/43826_1 /TAXON_ID=552665 /ORGANISM="Bigelowiella longifila, Strain CCMP242" /LENGTH=80 /DNA_ID=CAMNT_0027862873 /DNA_START=1058 /DNA_END=1296 /DNA_ORIENTATION=+
MDAIHVDSDLCRRVHEQQHPDQMRFDDEAISSFRCGHPQSLLDGSLPGPRHVPIQQYLARLKLYGFLQPDDVQVCLESLG